MQEKAFDYTALLGRVIIAPLYLSSGYGKILNPQGTIQYITGGGMPLSSLAYAIAVFVEIVLPVLLLLGYKTRLVALLLAVYTIVAALYFHANLGDHNQFLHFFKNLVIAGGLLQIVAFGAGSLSLDGRRRTAGQRANA